MRMGSAEVYAAFRIFRKHCKKFCKAFRFRLIAVCDFFGEGLLLWHPV